ncbi:MOSC domain-containing protein [Bacillus taeanensis]|uniref:MOSC domain-containing protein n=1 Tax=Bacillus taeanensis TaxID=273032 RepID=A0A366Y2X2_9BACI|nr:MOSC domain-containing protein [Bacillus taeanensis]RBW70753.1 MOSC domain-containing protein [Bacillus taeanensis]
MTLKIKAVNIGKTQKLVYKGKELLTSIYKTPVEKKVYLTAHRLEGDEQADLVHHGGEDKAVCVYPYEHYRYWEENADLPLDYGAFGENLTTFGLLEEKVCIGNIYQLGEAVVQVSQPRQPCYKLAAKHGIDDLALRVQQTGYTGFYFRVLTEGAISQNSVLHLIKKHPKEVTVSFANQIMHHDKQNKDAIKLLLEIDELSSDWKQTFLKRLAKIEKE